MFTNFEREFLENAWTDFLENFTNIFLSTKIYLGVEKSIVNAR